MWVLFLRWPRWVAITDASAGVTQDPTNRTHIHESFPIQWHSSPTFTCFCYLLHTSPCNRIARKFDKTITICQGKRWWCPGRFLWALRKIGCWFKIQKRDKILPRGKDAAYKLLNLQRRTAVTPWLRSPIYFFGYFSLVHETLLPAFTVNADHGVRTPDLLFRCPNLNLLTTVPLNTGISNLLKIEIVFLN